MKKVIKVRTVKELYTAIQEKRRISLTKEEKEMLYEEAGKIDKKLQLSLYRNRTFTQCGTCWHRTIDRLFKREQALGVEPKLVKKVEDKMVKSELTFTHTGGGWYEFSDGHRVRGKANAEEYYNQNK